VAEPAHREHLERVVRDLLVNGFRWSFYGTSDVAVGVSLGMTLGSLTVCLAAVWWMFKTGYRLKN
jgi:ABC-2 type transport system permease protein